MSSSETGMIKKNNRLGRGLGSLLGGPDLLDDSEIVIEKNSSSLASQSKAMPAPLSTTIVEDESRIWLMGIEKIHPNPKQPRKTFDSQKLQELAASIKEKGILQPIVVRKIAIGKFEIVAGERRWRAAQLAGAQEVPVILKTTNEQEALELALIENIQRHDLNPLEEAEAYEQLARIYNLTQQQISQKVGKDRATIANIMRLLTLAPEVKAKVGSGEISLGHAKVLASVTDLERQKEIANKIIALNLSVRATESLIKGQDAKVIEKTLDLNISKKLVLGLAEELQKLLGTKVAIEYSNGKGRLAISFYSDEELTDIVERVRKSWKT